ncbi:hypothetical protein DPMN_187394 [Dreissena polymorpha]|uniref:Uncharacterized protein n=1 Tax=Dreissena polymorpha TaxID=45954 RepID=A0A9D4IAB2_DREPO|nr:hypothetical protein DPMN_187394 [Dreissena polymorpha]
MLKLSRVDFLCLEPVLGVFDGDLKNGPKVGIKPGTNRSMGGHHIHHATEILTHIFNEAYLYA